MNSTTVQVVRWLTRIFNAYIGFIMYSLYITSLFPDTRRSPLRLFIFFTFVYGTVLAYKREGLAGLFMLVTWLMLVTNAVFMLRGESASEIPFLTVAVESLPFLLIGTIYLVCWWKSEGSSVREMGFTQYLLSEYRSAI